MRTFYIGMKEQLLAIHETEEGYEFSTPLKGVKPNRLALDPHDDERMYLAADEGLWLSEDNGVTWQQNEFTFGDAERMTSVAVNPRRQTNGHSTVYVGTEPSRMYYSEDSGESWTEFTGIQELPSKNQWAFPPRPETHFVRWITPSETDEDYIAVSVEAGAVFFTTDHGKTWNDRAESSPIDVHTLLKHPDDPARLFAANGGLTTDGKRGSYAESSDGGHSWDFMSEGLEMHPYLYHMVLHPNKPGYRLVSASKSASKAHGSERYSTIYEKVGDDPWVELANGLPTQDAYSHHLANDPKNVSAYYALNNFGIFYMDEEADVWEPLELSWSNRFLEERPYFFVVKE